MVADIQQLIGKIMSDPKIAASGNFSSKVYRDEPILFTAPQMEKFTPPRIREMRRIGKGSASEAKVFYEQGRFMEDFEDDYDFKGEFAQYFPTYQSMNDAQLRGYFSWRTRLRKGDVEKTSLSFAFVYIYELLNQIGVSSPEDGFHALENLWAAYREFDSRINSYLEVWLKDYVIYHNLDKALLDGLPDADFDKAVIVLLDYKAYGVEEVFHALNSLSSYDLEESRFFKQYPDDVRNTVHRVFSVVLEYYNKGSGKSAREKLFGRVCTNTYSMFRTAVFFDRAPAENRIYKIGNCHNYICENGNWSCERFIWYGNNNKRIGALLKMTDYLMRRAYGYKSTLRPKKINRVLTRKIEKVIAQYEEDKRKNAPQKIDIDISRLHDIRVAALSTQNKLLVEEPEEDAPEAAGEKVVREHAMGLTDAEFRFMQSLLYGREYVRSQGLMLSVLIDGINGKLFDAFGDTVLVDGGGGPELIEDYRDELKGMIAE